MIPRTASILVVGSANVDYIVRSDRLPRPGETVVGGELITAGGGKGANQAIAAHRLGARVAFVARIGDDGSGRLLRDAFRADNLDSTYVVTDSNAATGVALILVDRDGQNMISVAPGANLNLSPADLERARSALDAANVLVCQLEIPVDTVKAALVAARGRGLTTILNPAPARPLADDVLGLTDWLIPNEFEASTLTATDVTNADSAMRAGRLLIDRGARGVVVTLGDRGAVLVTAESAVQVAGHPVRAVDTTAAGDAFVAGFAVSVSRGHPAADALTYANAVGALATTGRGAQPSLPTALDVERFLERGERLIG